MKKFLTIIFVSIALFSCNGTIENHGSKNHRVSSKYSRMIKPSELLQAGIPKKRFEVSGENVAEYFDYEKSYYDNNAMVSEEAAQNYQGVFKIGDPYKIMGVSYFPQEYDSFEENGTASWYGDDFHGRLTANGEIYNMDEMTAAHRTLPLPSMVRVTNLRNKKSVIVRVNDRGPFAKNRILDVSERAAIALGFRDSGTTQVKIELLKDETDELLERLKIKN